MAISTDDGATWTHKTLETTSPPMVQATLAFPQGPVLALATRGLYRSDDRGATWRSVIADSFTPYFQYGVNKMDRSPYAPWAFVLREYHYSSDPNNRSGTIWFYELDTDTKTLLTTPQGTSRGPFLRVTKEPITSEFGPWPIKVWTGHGWDGYQVIRATVEEFRALTKEDWTSYIATAGVHADMSDLGVDASLQPTFLGSDGGIFKPRPTPTDGRPVGERRRAGQRNELAADHGPRRHQHGEAQWSRSCRRRSISARRTTSSGRRRTAEGRGRAAMAERATTWRCGPTPRPA